MKFIFFSLQCFISILIRRFRKISISLRQFSFDIASIYFIFLGCIIEEATDYLGHDIPWKRKRTENQQECADFSASTPGGHFWTWNKGTKTCYVKSSNSGKRTVGHAVSGNSKCGKKTGAMWEKSKFNFSDSECLNLGGPKFKVSLENCKDLCLKKTSCTAFNYPSSAKDNIALFSISNGIYHADCILRNCSLPVLPPTNNKKLAYDGYWLSTTYIGKGSPDIKNGKKKVTMSP